jgi:hypothetical protein
MKWSVASPSARCCDNRSKKTPESLRIGYAKKESVGSGVPARKQSLAYPM